MEPRNRLFDLEEYVNQVAASLVGNKVVVKFIPDGTSKLFAFYGRPKFSFTNTDTKESIEVPIPGKDIYKSDGSLNLRHLEEMVRQSLKRLGFNL